MQPLDADPGEITALLYAELRRIAAAHMRAERKDHTLTPTALVHEAWLRLGDNQAAFENRHHFLAIAATAMRRILVDYARARNADCRGGPQKPASLDSLFNLQAPMADETVLALDEALQRLEIMSERAAKVIEMRFFAGLTESEVATLLGVNRRTVNRDWEMARVWLYSELHDTAGAKRPDQH
jgi:RNA polymerase sigma-70 factor (ECF subfamily)